MSDFPYSLTIPYVQTNPITQQSRTDSEDEEIYDFYYYFNTPGQFGLSVPIQDVSFNYIVGGGGGRGGFCGSDTEYTIIPQNGGGGGGSGGEVLTGTIEQTQNGGCLFIQIDVGGIGEQTQVEFIDQNNNVVKSIIARPGINGGNGEAFLGYATENINGGVNEYTRIGGNGASGYNGTFGSGGQTAYQDLPAFGDTSNYSACVKGGDGTGSSGGGGGPASWVNGKAGIPGGSGGPGTQVKFNDGTGIGNFCPGGSGGVGCSYGGINSDGTYNTISAENGDAGSEGAVLIYFYSKDPWNAFSYYPYLPETTTNVNSKSSEGFIKLYTAEVEGSQSVASINLNVTAKASIGLKIYVPSDTIELTTTTSYKQLLTQYVEFQVAEIVFNFVIGGVNYTIVAEIFKVPTKLDIVNNIIESYIPLPSIEIPYYLYKIKIAVFKISMTLNLDATPDFSDMWLNIGVVSVIEILPVDLGIVQSAALTITLFEMTIYTYDMIYV